MGVPTALTRSRPGVRLSTDLDRGSTGLGGGSLPGSDPLSNGLEGESTGVRPGFSRGSPGVLPGIERIRSVALPH